jgi:hypothetical protein
MYRLSLVFSFLLAQLLDVLSTYFGIRSFDLYETNPLANLFFNKIGMDQFMLGKLTIDLILIILYILALKKIPRWHWSVEKSLQLGSLGSWGIVTLNILAILWASSYEF